MAKCPIIDKVHHLDVINDQLQAATPNFEVKRHGASGHSNDCMSVPPGSYSASNFAGAANIEITPQCGEQKSERAREACTETWAAQHTYCRFLRLPCGS